MAKEARKVVVVRGLRKGQCLKIQMFWGAKVVRYLYISQVGVELLGHVGAQPRGRCFLFLVANHLVPENG